MKKYKPFLVAFAAGVLLATFIYSLALNFYFLCRHPSENGNPATWKQCPSVSWSSNPTSTPVPAGSENPTIENVAPVTVVKTPYVVRNLNPRPAKEPLAPGKASFSYPQAIAIGPDNDLYIIDKGSGSVIVLRPDGTTRMIIPITSPVLSDSTGIAVSRSGVIYVSDQEGRRLLVFNLNGTLLRTITDLSPLMPNTFGGSLGTFPQGIAVAPDGYLYVADQGNRRIVVFRPDGTVSGSFFDISHFDPPTLSVVVEGIAISPSGEIYVSDENYRLVVFNKNGKVLRTIRNLSPLSPDVFHGPRGLTFAPNGKLYVTDCYSNRVDVLNPDDTALKSFNPGFMCPQGIVFSPATGLLYTAQSDNSVIGVFDIDGTPRQFINQYQLRK